MSRRRHRHHVSHRGGPYRSPGHSHGSEHESPVVAYFIDACLLLVILFTVLTIGHWAAMVELAARRFLGF
jgi:hypothetical protein